MCIRGMHLSRKIPKTGKIQYIILDIGESGEGVWDFKDEIGNSEVEKVANTLARQLRNRKKSSGQIFAWTVPVYHT